MLQQTLLIYRRQIRFSLRQPTWLVFALVQPLMYLVLFGPLLKRVSLTPGFPHGGSWQFFVPGMLVQLAIFGTLFVGFGLIEEIRDGIVDRMRVSPISRAAILFGHVLWDVTVLMAQAALLTAVGVAFGLKLTWSSAVGVIVGVVLIAVAFASISYAIAMTAKDEEPLVGALNLLAPPLLLLSGILLPMTLAPEWLQELASLNPVKHVLDGIRETFLGHIANDTSGWGLLWALALVVTAVVIAIHTFHRENP